MARVVILRGHQANPWELAPWTEPPLREGFEVVYLRTRRQWFDTDRLELESRRVLTLRDLLPPGRAGDLAVRIPGDRYLGLAAALRGADIVHAQELGYWYSMQAARLKPRLGFRLVLTVWETIPFIDSYRNVRTRDYRRQTLASTDLFLATTERARAALLLEGAPAGRIRVSPPGVDVARFAASAGSPRSDPPVVVSPGRLVWEKGHQDVLRAVAVLRRERSDLPGVRVVIVGRGPEEARLRAYAAELGIADAVELRGFVPYEEMPALYAGAACIVLASLSLWSWEEQFGMVLAEAMAAGAPIIASSSGAIAEVAGEAATLFAAGDWISLSQHIARAIDPAAAHPRAAAARELSAVYSSQAAAQRLADAYGELLSR
ncbi:MAG TPA: glycosyltransferase family 4 protein [Solirubrobacteraceae bacterium]|nr:glycosyltransferase family 4 protein [Solirubrobacteraceae bacterium]